MTSTSTVGRLVPSLGSSLSVRVKGRLITTTLPLNRVSSSTLVELLPSSQAVLLYFLDNEHIFSSQSPSILRLRLWKTNSTSEVGCTMIREPKYAEPFEGLLKGYSKAPDQVRFLFTIDRPGISMTLNHISTRIWTNGTKFASDDTFTFRIADKPPQLSKTHAKF